MSALDSLTEKQRIFAIEYAIDMDRLRAVKEAGYKSDLSVQAKRLLDNPKVKAALAEIGTKFDQSMLSIDLLVNQLYRFVTFDPAELEDEDGFLKVSMRSLPEHIRQCIAGFDKEIETWYDDEGVEHTKVKIKVRWIDKLKAVEYGMKWRQMLLPNSIQINNDNRSFNWEKFYENPPNVIEGRMREAIGDDDGVDVSDG